MEMAKAPGAKPAAAPGAAGGQAQVRFGVYNKVSDFAGKTVAEVRQSHGKTWGVPTDASAFLGKEKLDDSYVIQESDQIEFHRRAGEKG